MRNKLLNKMIIRLRISIKILNIIEIDKFQPFIKEKIPHKQTIIKQKNKSYMIKVDNIIYLVICYKNP